MINDALAKYKQHELRTYSLLKTITTSPGHPCPVVLEKILKNFFNLSKFKTADMKQGIVVLDSLQECKLTSNSLTSNV